MTKVTGDFEVTSWSEDEADGLGGTVRVTRTRIGQRFTGGIDAETVADLVMTYRDDGSAEFVGYQRVEGRIGELAGSFVLRAIGGYDGSTATTRFEVVAGSGRDDLAGLRGSGKSEAGHGSTGVYELEYER